MSLATVTMTLPTTWWVSLRAKPAATLCSPNAESKCGSRRWPPCGVQGLQQPHAQ